MLEILNIQPSWLPEVYECYELTGVIKTEIAKELGLNENVKIIGGGGDQAVGLLEQELYLMELLAWL